jgi:hypothetical protein
MINPKKDRINARENEEWFYVPINDDFWDGWLPVHIKVNKK